MHGTTSLRKYNKSHTEKTLIGLDITARGTHVPVLDSPVEPWLFLRESHTHFN